MELMSAKNPWLDPIAHLDSNARVYVHGMEVRFHDNLVDVRLTNLTVFSNNNIVLPIPLLLGEDNAIINAKVSISSSFL
jgi:hypothetical protein